MSVSKYLITLKPLTPFFFGGENTFGDNNVNYFVRSNYLPQQTTLLGFLRYELLLQNELLEMDPLASGWKDLIGESSFYKPDGLFSSDFGVIKKISPVFLSNGKNHFICQSLDWGISDYKDAGVEKQKLFPLYYTLTDEGEVQTSKYLKKVPCQKAGDNYFNQKNGIKSLWVSSDGSVMKQWDNEDEFKNESGFENGFFILHEQIGIYRKTKRTKDDTGDFYKIVRYDLANDFGFAFFGDLELSGNKKFDSRIVTMGGERSVFQMTISKTDKSFEDIFTNRTFAAGHSENRKALVLTSDAYSESPLLDYCDFAITETIPFRSISTTQQKNGDYVRIKGGAIFKAEELLYLLKRGSIFYGSDLSELKNALTNKAFQTIGYNHFIEL